MKKTFTINISGSIFHIDDDAFEKLQKYLHMLNRHFGQALEGQEILQDIEARIAELFLEKTDNKAEVVTDFMVDEVIARMGKPEDFMEQEEDSEKIQPEAASLEDDQKIRRRLYRDGDNRVLGGVCSGMGAYFNIDPVILRVIFVLVLFMGGASILVYIILWIAVPKAKTTAQRLEMRGKEATISNIEKSIKEEVTEVGESYNKFVHAKNEKGISRLDSFGDMAGSVLRVILRVIVLLFGAVLIIGGIASLIGFVTSIAIGHSFMQGGFWSFGGDLDFSITDILTHFVSPEAYTIALVSILILAGIPILLLLFIGTKLLFRYKTNNKLIGLGAFGLWLVALIILIFVSVSQIGNFSKKSSQTITQKIECNQCKTLYLETAEDLYKSIIHNQTSRHGTRTWNKNSNIKTTVYPHFSFNISRSGNVFDESNSDDPFIFNEMKIAMVNGKIKLFDQPVFTIEKSGTGEFSLLIKKQSRGRSTVDAQKNVEEIEYNFVQKDSTLLFDPYFFLKDKAKWRNQEVSMILKVPEGKSVYLNKNLVDIIYDIENVENMFDDDMVGKTWTMTADGLSLKPVTSLTIKK